MREVWLIDSFLKRLFVSRVEKKVEELDVLHKTHLSRPNLDDEDGEERNIQKLTQEATTVSSDKLYT